ncbi:hypothetical protein ACTJJ0_26500 [Chitinophaga sp. 22321]|uniref:Alpha/beta hydrolase family protein n=1 Tax=Chitinophaga hostae TaxID=2831022 RepID=A0ABS5J5N8_9BACT|nr:hypothetical protein [Chitinophaga hostae]MBS0030528.1 hypothetical protein [Chitinophaga hostae]
MKYQLKFYSTKTSIAIILFFTLVTSGVLAQKVSVRSSNKKNTFSRSDAQVWQWRISMDNIISGETKAPPQVFLWIPDNCRQLKAVVWGQHNMTEGTVLEHPAFRKTMAELGIGEIWVTPAITQMFDFTKNAPADFEVMMNRLAEVSGYTELKTIPVIPIGHSAQASFPWNFAAWNPARTLAVISLHGDAPLTKLTGSGAPNPDWGNRNIDGVPSLFIMGEYEWWEDRILPAFSYIQSHPRSVISLFADAGHGHFDASEALVGYISLFIRKAMKFRWRANALLPVQPEDGWLMDRWHKDSLPVASAAPFKTYSGNRPSASWVFDREMADATEHYYNTARGKRQQFIGFIQDGKVLIPGKSHAVYTTSVQPLQDGITFHISGFFTDSTRTRRVTEHAATPLLINRICGPVKKINDTTFRLDFYRMGFNNAKRSNDIWLVAENKGDGMFKSTVQQLNIKIPLPQTTGNAQQIHFKPLPDQQNGIKELSLTARATSGLPVNYYVKEGPVVIKGNKLMFTGVPPGAKLPLKVTVVAWQYGIAGKYQSALPVERSFFILQ